MDDLEKDRERVARWRREQRENALLDQEAEESETWRAKREESGE